MNNAHGSKLLKSSHFTISCGESLTASNLQLTSLGLCVQQEHTVCQLWRDPRGPLWGWFYFMTLGLNQGTHTVPSHLKQLQRTLRPSCFPKFSYKSLYHQCLKMQARLEPGSFKRQLGYDGVIRALLTPVGLCFPLFSFINLFTLHPNCSPLSQSPIPNHLSLPFSFENQPT